MGGTAARVAAADNGDDLSGFYSIKTLADKDNVPGIYVALQGNSDGTWNLPNDATFWNDVLTLVETNLCVDTTIARYLETGTLPPRQPHARWDKTCPPPPQPVPTPPVQAKPPASSLSATLSQLGPQP